MGFLETIVPMIPWVWLWNAFPRHVGYIKDVDHKVDTLMSEINELKRKREENEKDVKAAELIGKKRLRRVGDWFNDVDRIIPETESIKSESEQGIPNLFWQYKLGKRVAEKTKVVKKLNDQGVFQEVAEIPHQSVILERMMQVPGQLQQQSTSQETLKEIEEALCDEEVGVVGVVGMGGVGKTTLMKQIYNKFAGTQGFTVIWVTVSKDVNLQAIQQRIGNKLCMYLGKNDDIEERKERLHARLKILKYMLILDDLWEPFPLDQVGIPRPDKQNRCKIAITTRSMEVSNGMMADKAIKVRVLTSVEAWDLFCSKTGDAVLSSEIQPIARKVVEECGGLPLAIQTVGAAMRGKDRKELWQNALRALSNGAAAADVPGMEQQVFRPLKLSYDYLANCKIQSCFLCCCLFPEDYLINIYELTGYWICDGLIDNVDSVEEAVNEGFAIVEKLKDACLLEASSDGHYVKMHDLLRDLAIWITTSPSSSIQASSKFLVNTTSEVPPEAKNWEGCAKISLMGSSVRELQFIPNCADLVFLLLCDNQNLRAIHSSFFQLMPQLRILNLSRTEIRSLPPSLSDLVNLRALILSSCTMLVELPPLGALKEVQILDLSSTGILELPEGISNLVKLKQLDLSFTKALNKIPCSFISELTSLERLNLCGKFGMQVPVSTWRELAALKRLAFLAINLPYLPSFAAHDILLPAPFSHWKRFSVRIGVGFFSPGYREQGIFEETGYQNELKMFGLRDSSGWLTGIEELMRIHFEYLYLAGCDNLACVSQIIGYSQTLKRLHMWYCEGVKCIIDWSELADTNALDCLEDLNLDELPDLENIFDGGPPLPSTRFQRLQRVSIRDCPKLKCIFSSSMVSHLHQLEELDVRNCEGVEVIVQGDTQPPDDALQRLSRLSLHNLPKLTSISMQLPVLKSLEVIEVSCCSTLKKLPPLCSDIHRVRGYIKGPREWWEGIEWEDDHSKSIYLTIYTAEEREEEDEEDALDLNRSLFGQDYAESEEEPIHPTQPLPFFHLTGRGEDEPVCALQPPLLSLFPEGDEDESLHASQTISLPVLNGRDEDEAVSATQPHLPFFLGRGEDEAVNAIQPHLPFFLGRGVDVPAHALIQTPPSSILPGRGEDELVHDILSRPLTLSYGTLDNDSVHDTYIYS